MTPSYSCSGAGSLDISCRQDRSDWPADLRHDIWSRLQWTNLTKEIIELSLYMISSNLSFLPSSNRVTNHQCTQPSGVGLLLIILGSYSFTVNSLIPFSTFSTVLFPYCHSDEATRPETRGTQQLHICIGRRCTAGVWWRKMLLFKGCFPHLFPCSPSLSFPFWSSWWTKTLMFAALEDFVSQLGI